MNVGVSLVNDKRVKFSALFPWLLCGLGALFYCYEYLLRIAPSVMAPNLMQTFSLNAANFGFLMAFYYYIYTPMQLPVGVFMDRYGPRRLLVGACIICALGSLGFGLTHHASYLGIMRLFIGFGSAFAFVGVLKLATIWLPENRFALVSGLATALGMIGAMVGDDLMAVFVVHHGWRNTVIYLAYVGVVLALLIFLFMRDGPYAGAKESALPPTTFKKLWPEIKLLIANPRIWLNGLIGCLLYLPTSAFAELWGVPYLQSAYHFHREAAASAISMIFLGWAIGGPLSGWISDRLARRCLPIIVGAVVAAVLGSLMVYMPNLSRWEIYVLLLGFGIFSSVEVIVFAIGREISPADVGGTAVAFTNMLVMVGGVVFQPLIGKLLDMHWQGLIINNVPIYTLSDYKFALGVIPVGLFLSVLLMFFIKETRGQLTEIPEGPR